jgi:hypothetical protein
LFPYKKSLLVFLFLIRLSRTGPQMAGEMTANGTMDLGPELEVSGNTTASASSPTPTPASG